MSVVEPHRVCPSVSVAGSTGPTSRFSGREKTGSQSQWYGVDWRRWAQPFFTVTLRKTSLNCFKDLRFLYVACRPAPHLPFALQHALRIATTSRRCDLCADDMFLLHGFPTRGSLGLQQQQQPRRPSSQEPVASRSQSRRQAKNPQRWLIVYEGFSK